MLADELRPWHAQVLEVTSSGVRFLRAVHVSDGLTAEHRVSSPYQPLVSTSMGRPAHPRIPAIPEKREEPRHTPCADANVRVEAETDSYITRTFVIMPLLLLRLKLLSPKKSSSSISASVVAPSLVVP